MDVIGKIEKLCAERNWTLFELGKQSGISANTLYKWKSGTLPTIVNIERICQAFGISIQQFFCGIESKNLTDEQNKLLKNWVLLRKNQQQLIFNMMDSFILENKKEDNLN